MLNGVATVAAKTDWRRSSAEEKNVYKIGVSCTEASKYDFFYYLDSMNASVVIWV